MSNVPLRRKIWFGWTLARLGVAVFVGLAVLAGFAAVGITTFRNGQYYLATTTLTIAVGGTALLFVRLVILRYHIRVGMHRELRKRNCCPNCMYDLHSSPLRCPECGHHPPIANIEV